jgi:hypothetical protein
MPRKAGKKMSSISVRWFAIPALVVLSAAVALSAAQANPPIAGAIYGGTTSEGLPIVLMVNAEGTGLAAGSYVDFRCGDSAVTREFLEGTSLLLPAGVTNRSGTGITNESGFTLGFSGGTLSWRFFGRFFTQAAAPPGGGQTTFPTGPPPPGTQPPQFTQPPGEMATGDFSGRNNTGVPGGAGFCSFRVTWTVAATP